MEETYKEYLDKIIQERGQWGIPEQDYFEMHHIIPKSVGGKGDSESDQDFKKNSHHENCIWLYPEEHYHAHYLLAKENPNEPKLACAWYFMSHKNDVLVSEEEYKELRKIAQTRTGIENGMYGKHHTEESKRKMREHHPEFSWIQSEEGREITSQRCRNSRWYTNGIEETFLQSNPPEGWYPGRKNGTNQGGKNAASIKCYVYNEDKELIDICECINYAGLKYGLKDREAKSHTGWEKGPWKGYYFIKEEEVIESEIVYKQ